MIIGQLGTNDPSTEIADLCEDHLGRKFKMRTILVTSPSNLSSTSCKGEKEGLIDLAKLIANVNHIFLNLTLAMRIVDDMAFLELPSYFLSILNSAINWQGWGGRHKTLPVSSCHFSPQDIMYVKCFQLSKIL